MLKAVLRWVGLVLMLVSCAYDPIPDSPDALNVHIRERSGTRSAGLTVNRAGSPVVVWTETWQSQPCTIPPCSFPTGQFAKQWDVQSQSWKLLNYFSDPKLDDEHLQDILGLEFDRQDHPYLVRGYYSSNADSAKVWHWSGTVWELLGDPFVGGRLCGYSIDFPEPGEAPRFGFAQLSKGSFSIGLDDLPVLGWLKADQAIGQALPVYHWDGDSWVQIGAPVNPISGQELRVYRWDGGKWVQIGTSVNPISGIGLSCSGIRLDSDGNPVVAWARSEPTKDSIQVVRWTGSVWANWGQPLQLTKPDSMFIKDPRFQLELDAQNRPLLAFVEQGVGNVKVWDGTRWASLGNASVPGVNYIGLELDSTGRPILATSESATTGQAIRVRRWNGTAWDELRTLSDPEFTGFVFALTKDNPVVVYMHISDRLLHARVFDTP